MNECITCFISMSLWQRILYEFHFMIIVIEFKICSAQPDWLSSRERVNKLFVSAMRVHIIAVISVCQVDYLLSQRETIQKHKY